MSSTHHFHGGIQPPEHKQASLVRPLSNALVPDYLILPLLQSIGQAAKPIIDIGENVLKGQLVAIAQGEISAPIHAPSSGTVIAIEQRPVPAAQELSGTCIIIRTDGKEQWGAKNGIADYTSLTPLQLIEHIQQSGIVGLGGAGFPTHVKLKSALEQGIRTLIINAAECEPYITADDALMQTYAHEIVSGIHILQHLLRPEKTVIGIEDNKPRATKALQHALSQSLQSVEKIEVLIVPTLYPSGGEKQLIQLATGLEITSGNLPASLGLLCQNIGTVYALYKAVIQGEPLISRIVTLTGAALRKPQNFNVLLGTSMEALLQQAEITPEHLHRLVMGGSLMGATITHEHVPVIKTTNCIIAATEKEMPDKPSAQPCIRCGFCENVCPASLLPQQLFWFAKGREFAKAQAHHLFDCIECGACEYVCPSHIPLVQHYRHAKAEIRSENANKVKSDKARQRFEARQLRLAQEAIEKAQRRKERADRAAQSLQPSQSSESLHVHVPSPSPHPEDITQLKRAAAVARNQLKKAQTALKLAQDKQRSDTEKLRASVEKLERNAQQTEAAWKAAEQKIS